MHFRRGSTATTHATLPSEMQGADLGRCISEVREEVESLAERIDTLARLCATPALSERLIVAEGPFVGDAPAALQTCHLWLERSRQMLGPPAQSLTQAHVAAGGLANK